MIKNSVSRRSVMAGVAASAAIAGLPSAAHALAPQQQLVATTREIEVNGTLVKRLAVVGPDGPEGLRVKRGDYFRFKLTNKLDTETLIHWHGLILPPSQDGVPGISAPAIPPGGSADYDFPLVQAGTYWMHSHVGFQEQLGLAMPLILEDPNDPLSNLQEVVLFLEDFTFKDPEAIVAALRAPGQSDTAAGQGTSATDTAKPGMKGMAGMAGMAGMTGMAPATGTTAAPTMAGMVGSTPAAGTTTAMAGMEGMADLNDVDFDAYLANSRTLRDPQVVSVERNGKVRLRIINGSASTNFFISAGGQSARLIAVDGEAVHPIDDVIFPVGIAQRIDLLVDVPGGKALPIIAQREGDTARTGLILAGPGAEVAKLSDNADAKAGAIGVELEARLRAVKPLPERPIAAELDSLLSGDMAKYIWMMHGGVYPNNKPLVVRTGDRTAVRIRNQTGMSHPMHLHGHVFQVIEIGGKPLAGAVRDTVVVPPQSDMVIAFDANNPGNWAYHCHNLYHMEVGMFSYLTYVPAT
ncbi:multicopper oxidase family protein [Thalassobaculum sp.]|uniref:multicopper oxidase family protein n=1 Tax=Thalassobaculum sp. TaxID=2022740 RepID=UPI0032ED517A